MLPAPRPALSPGTGNRDHHTEDEADARRVGAPRGQLPAPGLACSSAAAPGRAPSPPPATPASSPGPAPRAEPGRSRTPRLGPALGRGTWLSSGMAPPPGSPGPRRHRPPRRAEPCRAARGGGGRARQAGRCSPEPPGGACGTCRRREVPPALTVPPTSQELTPVPSPGFTSSHRHPQSGAQHRHSRYSVTRIHPGIHPAHRQPPEHLWYPMRYPARH